MKTYFLYCLIKKWLHILVYHFKHMLRYRQLDSWERILVNLNQNSIILIQENALEDVICQYAAIYPGEGGGWYV